MTRTTRGFFTASAISLGVALSGLISTTVQAASINYGNFGPVAPGIVFQQVTESSATDPTPLFGRPTAFSAGLDFDPLSFAATSAGGGADITDGQLNFTVATGMKGVDAISLFEAGDYTLAGIGAQATSVFAGASIRATVTEVDNVPVAPFNLTTVNGSFGESLPGTVIVQPWSLGLVLNVDAQMAGLGFPPTSVATKLEVVIDNVLVAISEPGSAAFIAKKEFIIDIVSLDVVPEPGTFALAGLAMCGLGLAACKRA